MNIVQGTITQLTISDAPRLDPIRVMIENYVPGQGRITITCYGRAWTAAWFGMSGASVEVFFANAGTGYIIGNLVSNMAPGLKRYQKHDDEYLTRIVVAVQEALRRYTRHQIHGVPL